MPTASDTLKQKAKELGFWAMPPTIEEFLNEIGMRKSIYDFWIHHLKEIFPDNLHVKYNYILLTGAIGTGKSTISKISALYTLCKLLMLKNFDAFHLNVETKPIDFLFFHVKIEKARAEFVDFMQEIFMTNPFFQDLLNKREKVMKEYYEECKKMNKECDKFARYKIRFVPDGAKSNSSIGGDVIYYVFSEANFVNESVISYKINQAYKRLKSRFLMAMPYLGNIIVDTSAAFEGAVSDILQGKDFYVVRASQWDAKPFMYKGERFSVFIGDASAHPKIIEDEEEAKYYDPDKIIMVPKELEREFREDLYTSLLDLAGINVRSPDAIFSEDVISDIMLKTYTLPDIDIVFQLPFYGKNIKNYIDPTIVYYMHVDTSLRGDNTGIALAGWKDDRVISVEFCMAVHNNGSDIPMYLIEEFIDEVIKNGISISKVTADSYQSQKLLQDIAKNFRIETAVVNIENHPEIYFSLKKSMLDKTIILPKNKLLLQELAHLKMVRSNAKVKFDHPSGMTKDLADAVASVHFILREDAKKKIVFRPNQDSFNILKSYYSKILAQKVKYGIAPTSFELQSYFNQNEKS